MISVISLLVVVILSILLTRIATVALSSTGLSREVARFQARSAFSGTGFTTSESERVVRHPIRRRILMTLMLLGNAGVITAISSLILAFVNSSQTGWPLWLKLTTLLTGLILLWGVASSRWVDHHLSLIIGRALKRYTAIEVRDYASLLNLTGEYVIVELFVETDDWLANKTLSEARLWDEGILVLGIQRSDGSYLGAPVGATSISPGDTLVAYGRIVALEEIDVRRRGWIGEHQHVEAVAEQKDVIVQEQGEEVSASSPQDMVLSKEHHPGSRAVTHP